MSSTSPALASAGSRTRALLNVQIEDFKSGMWKFVTMFTDTHGVKLVFQGTMAYTNGKVITVPDVNLLSRPNMTEDEIKAALDTLMTTRGYIYHEGFHVILTDFRQMEVSYKIGERFKELVNVLEDVRIEHNGCKIYPGAKEALVFTHAWSQARVALKLKEAMPDTFIQTLYGLLCQGSLEDDFRVTNPVWKVISADARALSNVLVPHVKRVIAAKNTAAVVEIAKEVFKLIEEHEEKKKEEEEKDEDKSSSKKSKKPPKGKPSKGKGTPPKSGPGDSDESEPEESDDGDPAGDDSEGEDDSDGDSGGGEDEEETDGEDGAGGDEDEGEEEDGSPEPEDKSPGGDGGAAPPTPTKMIKESEVLDDEMKKAAAKVMGGAGRHEYRVYSNAKDHIAPPKPPSNAAEAQRLRAQLKDRTNEVSFAFGPVKRTLENLLKAQTRSYHVRGLDEGALDEGALHKLAIANSGEARLRQQAKHVFSQKMKVRNLGDTACYLSIDMSGSMGGGGRDLMAQRCAIVFAHALEAVGVPFEVSAWTTNGHHTEPKDNAERALYSRFGGLEILEVKRFDEKWEAVNTRLMHVRGSSANYDGESVLYAARRLMTRKEKRKVLFVLCDGIPGPDYGEDPSVHAQYLHTVVKEIRTATPVELIGIGIQAPAAGQFYKPKFVNVSDVAALPGVVLSQLKQVLL